MNILLTAINAKYIHSNPAVFSLRSCTGKYASHVDIIEFTINQSPSYILQEIYKKTPRRDRFLMLYLEPQYDRRHYP